MSSAQVVDARGVEVTLERLMQLTPHLGAATRAKLLDRMRQLQEQGQLVDATSFCCHELRGTPPKLRRQVQLTKHADGTQLLELTLEGEVLVPFKLLPDNAGVDLRGQYLYLYDTIPGEHAAEVTVAKKERADSIVHCEKLLRDLPVALANSKAALAAHVEEVDVELSELGAMLLEQARIKQEVETQKTKLAELKSSPVPQLDKAEFVQHAIQTLIHLRFGLNRLGSQLILVTRSPDDTSNPHSATPQILAVTLH